MTTERFWVIGGDYTCLSFKALKDGASILAAGPFDNRSEAQEVWQRLSSEHRSQATARFSIAAEQIRLPH